MAGAGAIDDRLLRHGELRNKLTRSRALARLVTVALLVPLMAGPVVGTAAAAEGTGRILGQVTKGGQPAANVPVTLAEAASEMWLDTTTTDANGFYVFENLDMWDRPYKVGFQDEYQNQQWAYQKRTFDEADTIVVPLGADVVVDEVLLPTGTLEVTAEDAITGAPIDHLCGAAYGSAPGASGCTDSGTLVLAGLQPGDYSVEIYGDDHYFSAPTQTATVVADQSTALRVEMEPAALISTVIQDARTGVPVADACVQTVTGYGGFGMYPAGTCSGPDGRVTIGGLTAGDYQLFVQTFDGVHGGQWVGDTGGTGRRDQARVVPVTPGQTAAISPILLDGAGAISGVVTEEATGDPVAGVCAFSHAGGTTGGPDPGPHCTLDDGRYTISALGPYDWPVQFIDTVGGHSLQWSGDRPTQQTAQLIRVRVGRTAKADAHLMAPATIAGRVTDSAGQPLQGDITAYNAVTGDLVARYALTDENGNYQLTGIAGPQLVKLRFRDATADDLIQWYRTSTTFATADQVDVPLGGTVTGIDFSVPTG